MSSVTGPPAIESNRLCLDFVNLGFASGNPFADPPAWPELVEFLAAKQIVSEERSRQLRSLPESDPQTAETLLRYAERLGTGLRESCRARLRGHRIQKEWVEAINQILRVTEGHDELEWDGTNWRLGFAAREEGLEWLLAAIARSAAELIADGSSRNLRQCANPKCQILFYDDSRTRRRRWCSMALCGNRSKVAAFARRRIGARTRAHHA